MKTTIDIPDPLLREAKMMAARDQSTLRAVVTRALEAEIERHGLSAEPRPRWRRAFGGLRHLREDLARVNRVVEETFEEIDEEMWR